MSDEAGVMETAQSVSGVEMAVGLSPFQMGLSRIRRNRGAIIAFWIVVFYVFVAAFAPVLVKLLNIDPYSLDREAINDFGLPAGPSAVCRGTIRSGSNRAQDATSSGDSCTGREFRCSSEPLGPS